MKRKWIAAVGITAVAAAAAAGGVFWYRASHDVTRSDVLLEYMEAAGSGDYGRMYGLLDEKSRAYISEEDFTERNRNIYEGIGAQALKIEILEDKKDTAVQYQTTMDTVAGELSFRNQAVFTKENGGYYLQWEDGLIFPDLLDTDKVRVSSEAAERGSIYDRDKNLLAGEGTVSSVGLVPGKMGQDTAAELEQLALLLDTTAESIQKKLDASWVREDSFVPIKSIPKENDAAEPSELKAQLLELPGVMITDQTDRVYPLGVKASLLVGYIQNISAEELEERAGQGYTAQSKIGKSGLELLYEERLHGKDGCKIWIQDQEGNEKEILAYREKQDGEDIQVTISARLQEMLYDAFGQDEAAAAAIHPYTGEVLALMSTPAYDNNDFILGMSERKWEELNSDPQQPMYNRFRAAFVPGSSFKPVTAAVGLSTGTLDPQQDFGHSGLAWQKDESWGSYEVTTLHEYEGPADLEHAMVYSDNIYFAKAALGIGADTLAAGLDRLGFGQELPFPIIMTKSQYINEGGSMADEITLADSGYGQGEILVNVLHMASIYSAFANEGNMIRPVLELTEGQSPSWWIEGAFTPEAAQTVKKDLIAVIEEPEGTGHGARLEQIALAGKTGTAEIKDSKEDKNGTELGWFNVFTADREQENPILLVTMVEDVKERGGSGYVLERSRQVLEQWFGL